MHRRQNRQDRNAKEGGGKDEGGEKKSVQEGSQATGLGHWVVDAEIPTETKVLENGYSWAHPVANV